MQNDSFEEKNHKMMKGGKKNPRREEWNNRGRVLRVTFDPPPHLDGLCGDEAWIVFRVSPLVLRS